MTNQTECPGCGAAHGGWRKGPRGQYFHDRIPCPGKPKPNEVTGWIACSDRMPEPGERILFCHGFSEVKFGHYSLSSYGSNHNGSSHSPGPCFVSDEEDDYRDGVTDYKYLIDPSHVWRPLPDTPTKGAGK